MKKILVFLSILFCVVLGVSGVASAKDYYFPNVSITINIQSDGSFLVEEARTYKFDGEFHWATYNLPKSGFDRIENFSIKDESGLFSETSTETNIPSTFVFTDNGSSYTAKFFYNAIDTEKTFTFSYKVIGGIKVYQDVTDFYWKLIGSGWDKETKLLEAYVYLPASVDENSVQVFGHGPLNGTVERIDGQGAYYKVTNVPAYSYVEARVIFPSSIMTAAKIIPQKNYETIMNEEVGYANETARERRNIITGIVLFALVWALFLFAYLYFFFKFGKEPKPQKEILYERDIPSDLPPAVVGYLLHMNNVSSNDFVATILYLVKKGCIAMQVKKEKKGILFLKREEPVTYFYKTEKSTNGLPEHVKHVYNFLFNTVSDDGESASVDDIKTYSEHHKETTRDKYQKFVQKAKEDAEQYGFFESRGKVMGVYFLLLVIIAFLSVLIAYRFNLSFLIFLIPILCAVFGILSITLKRLSKDGAEAYAEWNGLRRFLIKFSNLKSYAPDSIVIWENYLVYATTFGIADKVLKYLETNIDKIPQEELARSYFFASTISAQDLGGIASIGNIASSLNSAISAISSSVSPSTGSGGGFSGGGGGGGGGSGGGAG
ncbi:MAG: DUF2207 domain-containing protein [Candidatus Atribacteria bacterium]|nr:DUF2207 domain-containing protein [Candidatus Atribacteria bacterium]